jgi:signal transduction histidine kinase
MDPEADASRDLQRLRWIGVILPVAFVWGFELLRFALVDPAYPGNEAHLVSALLMAGAVLLFALAMSFFLDRAQRQLVSQNKDLSLTHAVSSALSGGLSLPDTLGAALERLVSLTDALAGVIVVQEGGPGTASRGVETSASAGLVVRHPPRMSDGLDWVRRLLDEPHEGPLPAPNYYLRSEVDTGILEVPLLRGGESVGLVRLVYHPAVRPRVSTPALLDIAGEIATSIELSRVVADLRRRERERAALYEVSLQLTGRAEVSEVLERITHHARELLGAERSVVCLADARPGGQNAWADRLPLTPSGSTCPLRRAGEPGAHEQDPACPIAQGDGHPLAFMARPLRGPHDLLGELCVSRRADLPFTDAERSLLGALADMAAVAVQTAHLRDAEQQMTILAERDRIARELHDSLAQVLGVFHLRLRDLEARARSGADGIPAELADLAELADESYRDVREAILGLRESIPDDGGLEGALREYLRKYSRQTGIQATLVCEGPTQGALSPRAEVQLLRVVQEALTNVRKHSGARRAIVSLDCRDLVPLLSIEDDGAGFDVDKVVRSMEGGFGLASMRERVEQVGGTLTVHTAPGEGTRIEVRLEAEEARGARTSTVAGAPGR